MFVRPAFDHKAANGQTVILRENCENLKEFLVCKLKLTSLDTTIVNLKLLCGPLQSTKLNTNDWNKILLKAFKCRSQNEVPAYQSWWRNLIWFRRFVRDKHSCEESKFKSWNRFEDVSEFWRIVVGKNPCFSSPWDIDYCLNSWRSEGKEVERSQTSLVSILSDD